MRPGAVVPPGALRWLLPILALALGSHGTAVASQHRRLLIRSFPLDKAQCRNTIAGPVRYADDRGAVCSAAAFDYKTGCCRGGAKHDCSRCNTADSCCASYEHCVSCCMSPSSSPEALMKVVRTVRGDPSSPLWPDAFEFCRFQCRTHGRSTSHENAYIGARHHCYSQLGKPMLDPPLPRSALDGVELVMSAPAQSCDAACKPLRRVCSAAHFAALNSCDRLREQVNCEAGCVTEAASGTAPYYVEGEAPKTFRPALCVVVAAEGKGAPPSSCSSVEQYQRRLCPCKLQPDQPV